MTFPQWFWADKADGDDPFAITCESCGKRIGYIREFQFDDGGYEFPDFCDKCTEEDMLETYARLKKERGEDVAEAWIEEEEG